MNNQKRILTFLSVFILLSGVAMSIIATPLDADDGVKVGSGSCDGCVVTYVDSETSGYGIMTVTLDEVPNDNRIVVKVDGIDSAPMSLDGLSVTFACYELSVGDHLIIVDDGAGYRATVSLVVEYDVSEDKVQSISLNRTSETLIVGERSQLSATVEYTGDHIVLVEWTSSDDSVVTVSSNGLVTSLSVGEALITAGCGGVSATCVVVVKSGTIQSIDSEDISLDGSKVTVNGVEKTFDDGTKRLDVVESIETDTEVKTVNKVVDTDSNGNSTSLEVGTIEIKGSDIVMDVERSSESVQGTEVSSDLTVKVKDESVSTTASEKTDTNGTVVSMTTVIESAVMVEDGSSKATIDDSILEKAKAQIDAVSGQVSDVRPEISLIPDVESTAKDVKVSASMDGLKMLVDDTGSELNIVTPVAIVAMDDDALEALWDVDGDVISFVTNKLTTSDLSDEHSSLVGDNPVFDLSVFVDSVKVSDFGDGTVEIAIPYEPKDDVSPSDLKVWCISGSEPEVFDCTFVDGTVSFSTPHLSVWTIGTSINEPSDDDPSIVLITVVLLIVAVLEVGAIVFFARRS